MIKEGFGPKNPSEAEEPIFDRPKGSEDLEEELGKVNALELHISNLYDQNEDASGEKTDAATGEPFDNTTMEVEGINIKEGLLSAIEDPEFTNDAAARWLRENDPTWGKKK